MKVKSVIKENFDDVLLRRLAGLCDNRRMGTSQQRMSIGYKLLKRAGIKFIILGGATNRIAVQIGGLVFKIAVDRQGFKDNLMEYALSPELLQIAPVPKAYETNGYVLVCETWRLMTKEEWKLRRVDILKILDRLGQKYLLGDVGYIPKNYTNWGINDQGDVGILDYAYIHRGTANLFTCDVCGEGMLVYDSTFTFLRCNNVIGSCNTQYDYLERKNIEGDQVDFDMIDAAKEQSLKLGKGVKFIDVVIDDGDDVLIDSNTVIIRSPEEHRAWEIKVSKMKWKDNREEQAYWLRQHRIAKTEHDKKYAKQMMDEAYDKTIPDELRGITVKIAYEDEEEIPEEEIDMSNENETRTFRPRSMRASVIDTDDDFDDELSNLQITFRGPTPKPTDDMWYSLYDDDDGICGISTALFRKKKDEPQEQPELIHEEIPIEDSSTNDETVDVLDNDKVAFASIFDNGEESIRDIFSMTNQEFVFTDVDVDVEEPSKEIIIPEVMEVHEIGDEQQIELKEENEPIVEIEQEEVNESSNDLNTDSQVTDTESEPIITMDGVDIRKVVR